MIKKRGNWVKRKLKRKRLTYPFDRCIHLLDEMIDRCMAAIGAGRFDERLR